MIHKAGDRIGGTCLFTNNVYIGTLYKIEGSLHYMKDDDGVVVILDTDYDNIKPVCKSREIVYVR